MKVGLQLFSIFKATDEDMKNALKKVKEMGYDYIEFADYYDYSAEELRAMLDETGLECISSHQKYEEFFKSGNVEFLKTLGAKFCAVPWMDRKFHKGGEEFDKMLDDFTNFGNELKENGIQFTFHNHDCEFEIYEGKFLLDWLFESLPADILETEIDAGWVHEAGYDPAEYILKYSGRARTVHFKDFAEENGGESSGTAVGDGIVDFPALIKACEKAGTEYAIVEVEQYDVTADEQLAAAERSREYLKSLGI